MAIPLLAALSLCLWALPASLQTGDPVPSSTKKSAQQPSCDCHATSARYNIVNQPKSGYDFIPIKDDDSLGFYVAYSAKQNESNTGFVSTSCMYVLPLLNDEVLIFGGGFGDTWYIPGGAFFDADYDASMIKEAVVGCMGRDLATTRVRFVAPHGHPDHITVAFIKALERTGFNVVEIAYHEGDRTWIEQLPWLGHHPSLFRVLPSAPCGTDLKAYRSPLGLIWVTHRPGHTPGSVDLVLDIDRNPQNRVLLRGSAAGGCPPPSGVTLTLAAHGTAIVGGPRPAETQVLSGKGINRACLTSISDPKLGSSWVTQINVEGHPKAAYVYLFGSDCRLLPGEITPFGELLVDPLGGVALNIARPVFAQDNEYVGMEIPRDPSLMGRTWYVQAAVVGGGVELCNALRVTIGL